MAGGVKLTGLAIAVFVMFLVLGGLTGWLVGASREPAVGALLPALLGVSGIVGLARLPRLLARTQEPQPAAAAQTAKPSGTEPQVDVQVLVRSATFLCCGVIAYCVALFLGAKVGVRTRVADRGALPSIDALLPPDAKVTDAQYVDLLRLRMVLAKTDATETEAREVVKRAIRPKGDPLADVLSELVDRKIREAPPAPAADPTALVPLSSLVSADDLKDAGVTAQLERMRLLLARFEASPATASAELAGLLASARAEQANGRRYIERTRLELEEALSLLGSGPIREAGIPQRVPTPSEEK